MLVPTEPFDQFPHSAPMIIDMSNGFHFRPEGLGFLLAWNDPEETPGYKTEFDRRFHRENSDASRRSRAAVRKCRGESQTRLGRPLRNDARPPSDSRCRPRSVPGFFLANGFSGHGVMHAPATGKIFSDLILTGKTDLVDASLLELSRFAEGRMIEETAVL